MRFSKSLAVLACMMFGAAGLYMAYDSTSAGSMEAGALPPRIGGLGDLLNPSEDVGIREMPPQDQETWIGEVMSHPAYLEAQMALEYKGFQLDCTTRETLIAMVDGTPVRIFTIETVAVNGTYGVIAFASDDLGNMEAWYMITNIGQKSIMGTDPTISTIPVYTWSNGMPVYFVSIWQWWGYTRWVPYHYWWHNSHNHPNWYYSYYNYWWWYHQWYDYPSGILCWYGWTNWYYCWFYWRYFYYWSTHFPY